MNTHNQTNIGRHRSLYLLEGFALTIVGMLALIMPWFTALTVNVILGIALIAAGLGRLLSWRRGGIDSIWKLIGGLLFLAAGLLMIVFPVQGVALLILLLGIMLLLESVIEITTWLNWRSHPHSGWILASGLLSLILGLAVLSIFPEAGVVYLAVIFGISLILSGTTLLIVAWGAESTEHSTQT